jgi:hypothetical protein
MPIPYLLLVLFFGVYSKKSFINGNEFMTYEKVVETDNVITGTGNKLKDVAYRSLCLTLNCDNNCCDGQIEHIKCAKREKCDGYWNKIDNFELMEIIIGVMTPYILAPIFWCITKLNNKNQLLYDRLTLGFTIYLSIILPPYGITLLVEKFLCKKTNLLNNSKNANFMPNNNVLFSHKDFELENFRSEVANKINMEIENENFVIQDIVVPNNKN